MAKKRDKQGSKRKDVQGKTPRKSDAPKRRPGRPRKGPEGGLREEERTAAVIGFFIDGKKPAEIASLMQDKFGVDMSRQEPYKVVLEAARSGLLRFTPPPHSQLRQSYRERYFRWLQDVEVVSAVRFDQVASYGARMLLDLVYQKAAPPHGKEEVHIGIAGGNSMRHTVYEFARLLRQPGINTSKLPKKLVFRALVSAWERERPSDNPGFFFTYLVEDPAMPVETEFVPLPAPLLVNSEEYYKLLDYKWIREPYDDIKERRKLDIVVTSASSWSDPHSMYHRYMEYSKDAPEDLEKAGIVGDLMWQPVGPKGPLDWKTQARAITLIELEDFPDFMEKNGTQILLVLGPCGKCHMPKTDILRALLGLEKPLITHLVVDSRTAAAAISA